MIAPVAGVLGMMVAAYGFGFSVGAYLFGAPDTGIYDLLGHYTIVLGAVLHLLGFAVIDPAFFAAISATVEWIPAAFLGGGLSVWLLVQAGI